MALHATVSFGTRSNDGTATPAAIAVTAALPAATATGDVSLSDPDNPIGEELEAAGLLSGYPAPSTTGCRVALGELAVFNGEYDMEPDEVLTNTRINGNLVPNARCVVRDCVIFFDHNYGIDVRVQETGGSISVADRPLIEYCTIDGTNALAAESPLYGEGNPYKLSHCKIINFGAPPFMTSNQEISDCFIESYRYSSGIHKEAIFHNGGTNNVIARNTLIGNGNGTSAAIALYGEVSAVTNMLVDSNLLAVSQGYCLYTGSLSYKPFPDGSNVDIVDNHFMDLSIYNSAWDFVGYVTGDTDNGDYTGNVIHNGPNQGDPV